MREITKSELTKILDNHKKWLEGVMQGERADLCNTDLRTIDLSYADLRYADLQWADLSYADLCNSDLRSANLGRASLKCADFRGANLCNTNLCDADLSGADLSGAIGLLSPIEFLSKLEKTTEGIIVYKIFDMHYTPPAKWKIAPGSVITENVDFNRCSLCGCGINVGTLNYIKSNYGTKRIWKCLIRWEWLPGVVVPYNTDGKFRTEKLELLEELKEEETRREREVEKCVR